MSANICIMCKNSCGLCAWSANYKPVEGWTAKPIKKKTKDGRTINGYFVVDCPKYEPGKRISADRQWTSADTVILKQAMKQRVRHKRVAELLNKPLSVIEYRIMMLKEGKLK